MSVALVALLSIVTGLVLMSVIQLAVVICQLNDLIGYTLTQVGLLQQVTEAPDDREVWTW